MTVVHRRLLRGIGLVSMLVSIAACGGTGLGERPMVDTTDTRSKTLVDLTEESPQLDRFRRALRITGMDEMLRSPTPLTVFAPANEGFLPVLSDSAVRLSPDTLQMIVGLHLVRGSLERMTGDSMVVSTVAEHPVTIRRTEQGLTIQGRPITQRFIARNGVLYLIPSVIEPPPPDTTRGLLEQRALRL